MLEEPSLLFLIISLLCLLLLSGFFSGSETGMMAANKIKLKNLAKKNKDKGAKRALKLLKRPDQLLSTILVGNNFANILASAIVTIIFLDYLNASIVLGSFILTIVILIFSEITPKTMAAIKPEGFASKSSFLLRSLLVLFRPLIVSVNFLSSKILAFFKFNLKDAKNNDNLNTQELKTLLEESGDLIPKQHRQMLSSILRLDELIVEDIMIPTNEIIGIDRNNYFEDAKRIIENSDYSRLPVFDKSIDKVIGMLHIKDSHEFIERLESQISIKKVLDKPYFVSQSTALMKQLKEFQRNEKNIALVVDEYGEIQGLVSIEDIFKEIVGKFESDKVELNKEFFELKDGAVVAEGNSRIRDLNNHLKWNLPEDGPKTINGLITEFLETIPQNNLCVAIKGYKFEIIEIEDNAISKIKIKKGS